MIDRLINQLDKLSPLHPVPDPERLEFPDDGEASETCAFLKGRTWKQIRMDELRLHWDVVAWLDPACFHYYLPSVMLCSLQEWKHSRRISDMELPVDSVFYYIAKGNVFDENGVFS